MRKISEEKRQQVASLIAEGYSHTGIEQVTGVSRRWITSNFPGTQWSNEERDEFLRMQRQLKRADSLKCKRNGCTNPVRALRLCNKHYLAQKRARAKLNPL